MTRGEGVRLTAYLGHIREAIERCYRYVEDYDESAFLKDEKTQCIALIPKSTTAGEHYGTHHICRRFQGEVSANAG